MITKKILSTAFLVASTVSALSLGIPVKASEQIGSVPEIQTPTLPNGWTGRSYTATVRGRDADVGDRLVMVSAGLPDGLEIGNCRQQVISNSERLFCDISGTPLNSGTHTFKIGVVDQNGNTGSQTYTIDFTQAP